MIIIASSVENKISKIGIPKNLLLGKENKPHEVYLYTILKLFASNNLVSINVSTLMKKLKWKDHRTLKRYLFILKTKKFINFDFETLPKFQPMQIRLTKIKIYTSVSRDTLNKLIDLDCIVQNNNKKINLKESILRLYIYYIEKYNEEYKYAFPSYAGISEEIGLRNENIKAINSYLMQNYFLYVQIGGKIYLNEEDHSVRERNKYIPRLF